MNTPLKITGYLIVFAIAMGLLEAAVFVYIRAVYYPNGFQFPLVTMHASLTKVEVLREAATLLMLIAVGYLAGNTKLQRFSYFTLAFAIWDIFYYVFLYLFLGWPQSFSTWDILFLIPMPWIGPVWAPCLIALVMILGSLIIIYETNKQPSYTLSNKQWFSLISGALICLVTFMWDYYFTAAESIIINPFSSKKLFYQMANYVPHSFNTGLFYVGLAFMSAPICFHIYTKLKHT